MYKPCRRKSDEKNGYNTITRKKNAMMLKAMITMCKSGWPSACKSIIAPRDESKKATNIMK